MSVEQPKTEASNYRLPSDITLKHAAKLRKHQLNIA